MAETYLQSELRRRMRLLKLSSRQLSERAGLGESAVKEILNGRVRSPRHDTLSAIAKALGCTVAELTDPRAPDARLGGANEAEVENGALATLHRLMHIAEVEIELGAATGGAVASGESTHERHEQEVARWAMPSAVVRAHTAAPANRIKIVRVRGDSMKPDFQPGDRVMVDLDDVMPSPSGVFAIWDGFGQVIKRLEMIPYSDPPKVVLLSANPAYPSRELALEGVVINGRVVGKWDRT